MDHKKRHFYFYDNFGKDRPISQIVSLLYSEVNRTGTTSCSKIYHLPLNVLLHYLVKIVQLYMNTCIGQNNLHGVRSLIPV